jgi:hypothetical protein
VGAPSDVAECQTPRRQSVGFSGTNIWKGCEVASPGGHSTPACVRVQFYPLGGIETGTLNVAAIDGVRAVIEYIATWGSGNTLSERMGRRDDFDQRVRAWAGSFLSKGGTRHSRRPGMSRSFHPNTGADGLDHACQARAGSRGECGRLDPHRFFDV